MADPSVILKWYLPADEPYQHQALLLLNRFVGGDVRILLPDLALYEIGNRLARIGTIGKDLFNDVLNLFTDVWSLGRDEHRHVFRTVLEQHKRGLTKLTIYDGTYVHLAGWMNCPLITADRIQGEAGKAEGVKVVMIQDYA
ncbi:MAG: type II toxin-antitoxin system VapC family toxin [Acidobacteria bacterium]|nr:type II toxin-antitoxin system VapC family toxin [Acidobacteriota bacterium]